MSTNHNQRPKAGLHQTVRNIAVARQFLILPRAAIDYLRHAAECVSPDDLSHGRTPWCYERVDDFANILGVSPRTILNIEKRLVALGLIERRTMANGHRGARRCRNTGELIWVHGISLAPLVARQEEFDALATRMADHERAYRATRQKVNGVRARLKETLAEATAFPALSTLRNQTWAIFDACPARMTRMACDLNDLTRLHAELTLALDTLVDATDALCGSASDGGDNLADTVKISGQAEINCRHKYPTIPLKLYSCKKTEPPKGGTPSNYSDPAHAGSYLEWKCAGGENRDNPQNQPLRKKEAVQITARAVLDLAPDRWQDAIKGIDVIDWTVIGFVAAARRAELGVSEHAWRTGVERMGERQAAICLAILDTNQRHPTKPVQSVGGAFVAMTRRADAGNLNLEPSIRWIIARSGAARRDGAVSVPQA